MEEPKDPDTDHLYQLYSLVASAADRQQMADTYRKGGFGYGEVKKALADAAESYFAEPRARRADLAAKPDLVREILEHGAVEARRKASEVLRRAHDACGIGNQRK